MDINEIYRFADLVVEDDERAISVIVEATDQFYLEVLESSQSLLENLHKHFKDEDILEDEDANINIYILAFENGTTELHVSIEVGDDYWDEERMKISGADSKALFEKMDDFSKTETGKSVKELIEEKFGPEKKSRNETLER
jgi:hypothetical protein